MILSKVFSIFNYLLIKLLLVSSTDFEVLIKRIAVHFSSKFRIFCNNDHFNFTSNVSPEFSNLLLGCLSLLAVWWNINIGWSHRYHQSVHIGWHRFQSIVVINTSINISVINLPISYHCFFSLTYNASGIVFGNLLLQSINASQAFFSKDIYL